MGFLLSSFFVFVYVYGLDKQKTQQLPITEFPFLGGGNL